VIILDENNYALCYDQVVICDGCKLNFPDLSEGHLKDSMQADPLITSVVNGEFSSLCAEDMDWNNAQGSSTGMKNNEQEEKYFSVYPNPSSGSLYIKNVNLAGSYNL
jgi:hypothetical protein